MRLSANTILVDVLRSKLFIAVSGMALASAVVFRNGITFASANKVSYFTGREVFRTGAASVLVAALASVAIICSVKAEDAESSE